MTYQQAYITLALIVLILFIELIKDTLEEKETLNRWAFLFVGVICPLIN